MFKLIDFGSEAIKKQKLAELKKMIDELSVSIPEIVSIEAGINFSTRDVAFDLVLVSDFKSESDLKAYSAHPEHQKLVEFLKNIKLASAVVDYYYEPEYKYEPEM
jgi:hypothetical protein